MISSVLGFATNPSGITPPLLLPSLNLKKYMGVIDGTNNHKLRFFIDADVEMA
jgi:hypothetical protein